MRKLFTIAFALVLAAGMASVANAQRIDGDLRGEVRDPGGAMVPGAKVVVTSQGTGAVRNVESSSAGVFFAGNLLPGKYDVSVEVTGFKKAVRRGVEVSANRVSEVIINVEVGEVTTVVEVTAGAEVVQISTATLVGATFTKDELTGAVAAVSLDGSPLNLAVTAPGTTTQSGGVAGTGGSIGGNRPRQNNFVVDGLDNNDPSVTGPLTPVIADAIDEFTLLTNQFGAEFGHSTAGQFIMTTRSGTNQLHGRGWLYVQNRSLNSLDNVTRSTTAPGDPKPKYDWQRYGGQAGGPIFKDKLFYFGSYERHELDLAGSATGGITVPTAAGLAALNALAQSATSGVSPVNVGIISGFVPVAASATGTRNVCNEGVDPTCVAAGSIIPIEVGTFSANAPNFIREHRFMISSDANLGAHRVSGRYFYSRQRSLQVGDLPVDVFNSDVVFDTRRFTVSDVWTIRPTIVNELRLAYLRENDGFFLSSLPPGPGTTDVFGNYQIPDMNLFIGPGSSLPQGSFNNIYQLSNNTTWAKGAHTFKWGGDFRMVISPSDFLPRARGEYEWVANQATQRSDLDAFVRDFFPSSVSIRGVGLSRFAQNRAAFYWFFQDSWKIHPHVTVELGIRYEFTQVARDNKLQNLNGLANITDIRTEVWTQDLIDACFVNFCITPYPSASPVVGTSIFDSLPARQQQALLDHIGTSLTFAATKPDRNNWGPRLGVAWDVFGDGKTSLRAGFAIGHDVTFGNLPLLQLPPQAQAENRETNACSLTPSPAWCAGVAGGNPATSPGIRFAGGNTGFIEGGALLNVLPGDAGFNRVLARNLTGGFIPEKETTPETYTWSLAVQREMWKRVVFETRYVGTRGVHLPIQRWVSAGIPNPFRLPTFASMSEVPASFTGQPTRADFDANSDLLLWAYGFQGVITKFSPDGYSNYHGLSFSGRSLNLPYGLTVNGSYTFSKVIDVIENELFTSFMNPRRPFNMIDIHESKGRSGLDHTHKFVISWAWDIPGYKGDQGFVKKLTSGWNIAGTYVAETGQPLTPLSRRDINGDFDTAGDRAFFNPGGSGITGTDVTTVCFFGGVVTTGACPDPDGPPDPMVPGSNPLTSANTTVGYVANDPTARYVRPGAGSIEAGSLVQLGRNTLEGPGINNFNFSIAKTTPFWGEGRTIRFQADLINAFNHPSFSVGNGSVFGFNGNATGFPNFVTPGTSDFLKESLFSGGLGQAPFQRVIQFGLKVNF